MKTLSGAERKKVRAMKTLVIVAALFLVAGGVNAFASEVAGTAITSQSSIIHVEYTYNAYGVGTSGYEKTTTTTNTKSSKDSSTSTTVQVSEVFSSWHGGSLKADNVKGTSDTNSSDGTKSHTDFWTKYDYSSVGVLTGASGGAHTEGTTTTGKYTSDTTDTYQIRDGVALRTSSHTEGTNYGVSGSTSQVSSTFTQDTTYSYTFIAGQWQISQSVDHSVTNGTDGSVQDITKTTTYSRDAKTGVTNGLTQTAYGTNTAVGSTGGTTSYTMTNYSATASFDPVAGWYISKETWDWTQDNSSSSGGSGGGGGGGDVCGCTCC